MLHPKRIMCDVPAKGMCILFNPYPNTLFYISSILLCSTNRVCTIRCCAVPRPIRRTKIFRIADEQPVEWGCAIRTYVYEMKASPHQFKCFSRGLCFDVIWIDGGLHDGREWENPAFPGGCGRWTAQPVVVHIIWC